MASLFAVFSDSEQYAIDRFLSDMVQDKPSGNLYGCFAPFYNLYIERPKDSKFYLGFRSAFWIEDAIEEINSKFSNIHVRLVFSAESEYYLIEGMMGEITHRRLQEIKKYYNANSQQAYCSRILTRLEEGEKKGPMTSRYTLVEISTSDAYTENGEILVKKLVSIMFRMLSPNFNYISKKICNQKQENYLQVIANCSKSTNLWLSISSTKITEEHLLLLNSIELVNNYAKNLNFHEQGGYAIKQTECFTELYKASKAVPIETTSDEILRYHKNVFWPKWADEYIRRFIVELNDEHGLILTGHANKKFILPSYINKKEEILNHIQNGQLDVNNVFEFYLSKKNKIKKICHRSRLTDSYDLTIVISRTGKIVTFYINRTNYTHKNLNHSKYVKEN